MLRMYFWPWTFMILLIIIKLELRWKTMSSIARINHMSCLSTMTTNIRNISSSKTTSVSIIHYFWLITKKLSLLVCTNRANHMLLRTNMIRWKILWGINNFGHDKCSNQSSQIRALIPYYENKEKNKDEQKNMRMNICSLFFPCISFKIKNWIYTSTVPILGIAK